MFHPTNTQVQHIDDSRVWRTTLLGFTQFFASFELEHPKQTKNKKSSKQDKSFITYSTENNSLQQIDKWMCDFPIAQVPK